MVDTFSPFVFWAQTKHQVTLRVDLKDVKDPEIVLNTDKLEFTAQGTGARGSHKYGFLLHFFSELDPEVS